MFSCDKTQSFRNLRIVTNGIHRCQPLRDSNWEVVSEEGGCGGIPPQVAKIFDISTSIWCKITAPFKIIIQCTSFFSKVGLSLYLYRLKFLINSTLKILYLHINVQINSRREGYIIILYQIIWFFSHTQWVSVTLAIRLCPSLSSLSLWTF